MDKKKKSFGLYIIASAIIWAAVIIGCALKLKGTECYDQISHILIAGFFIHLIAIWGPLGAQFKNKKGSKPEELNKE